MVFQLRPQFKIIIPITYTPTKPHTDQMIARNAPTQKKKKSSILPHIAILVPHDELVMKSYMHVRLTIVETHYHNLNVNIRKPGLLAFNS